MVKGLLCLVGVLLGVSLFAQNEGDQAIIDAVYPNYTSELNENGGLKRFEEESLWIISNVDQYPLDSDSSQLVVQFNWRCENYVEGEMSEFFVMQKSKTSFQIKARPEDENSVLFYGGGTQRYNEPTIVDEALKLGDAVIGFLVKLESHHFASQTEAEEYKLFAVVKNEVRLVLEYGAGRYSNFSVEDFVQFPEQIDEFFENLGEYIPNETYQKSIKENRIHFAISQSKTDGMFNIMLIDSIYSLFERKPVLKLEKSGCHWNGVAYECLTLVE